MRFRPILLRLLLCLALLANGTTAAFASAQMAFGSLPPVVTAHDGNAPPCHDGMPAMDDGAMLADHGAPEAPDLHGHDCCLPGACLCSCISHVPTIPAFGAFAIPMRPSVAPVAALRVSFSSPALPHLIRPPIG